MTLHSVVEVFSRYICSSDYRSLTPDTALHSIFELGRTSLGSMTEYVAVNCDSDQTLEALP